MQRSLLTVIGVAVLGGIAIFLGRGFLAPAAEQAQAEESVLTGAYEPRLESIRALDDSELPRGLRPPAIDEDLLYLRLEVVYPNAARTPPPASHHLDQLNGGTSKLEPVHAESLAEEEGTVVLLTYRTDSGFSHARLVAEGDVVVERVMLD